MADRLGVAPESADAAEDDRARRTRAREKARAQSSGALREEARRDPPNPARLTCGERIGPYTGKTRAGVASFRAVGHDMATAPFDAKEEHQAIGNVLSGGAETEGCVHCRSPRASAAAAPRPAPAPRAQNAKNEAFGRVVPAFSRANAGWRIGPECAPPRRGQPRGASSTRVQHPAARAGGPVPARDNPAHPSARAGSVDNPPGSFTQTLASAARFSISPGSRRVRRVRHFFRLFFRRLFFCFSAGVARSKSDVSRD